jgi:hypothetical protein
MKSTPFHAVSPRCLLISFSLAHLDENWNMQGYKFASVLYGYETWSLILRKEHRLRTFENRVLRRTFGQRIN